jgi:hypothetical protein
MKINLTWVLLALPVIGIVFTLWDGVNKAEYVECLKLQSQSREYSRWYSTDWERAMCDKQGVPLPAGRQP